MNLKKVLASICASATLFSVCVLPAAAAPSYGFNNWISGTSGFTTNTMRKDNNGTGYYGQYRVTFQGSKAGGIYINLFSQLRAGNQRSGDMLTYEGTTNWGYNSQTAGQNVHLYGRRQYSSDGGATVWGTWSSDRT